MAVHPLRPATHHRHGGPLPHHLANGARAHPPAAPWRLSSQTLVCPGTNPVLSCVSTGYPRLEGRLPTCYSPVRRFPIAGTARLACLKRAASVRSEPGSNSPLFEPGPKPGIITSFFPFNSPPLGGISEQLIVYLLSVIELTGSPHSFLNSSFLRLSCKELFVLAFWRAS